MALNHPALTAAEQATIDACIIRARLVNTWLKNLKTTDAARFEAVRKLPFEEIATMAGL